MTNIGRATYIGWGGMTLELLDIDSGGLTAVTEAIDRTKYGTSIREFSPGYTDPGSVSVTIVTEDATVTSQLRVMHELQTVAPLSIVLPTGLQLTANAFIISFGDSVEKMGLYTLKVTFKLTGKVSRTTYVGYRIVPQTGTTLFRGCSYTLHLSGSGGTDPAGANATFAIDAEAHGGISIDNDLDLLIIDKTTELTSVTVSATIQPEPPALTSIEPVRYTIVKPDPTAMSISGDQIIEHTQTELPKSHTYTISTYPVGADTTAKWSLLIYKGREWKAPEEADKVEIQDNGILKILSDHAVGTSQLQISAKSTKNTSVTADFFVTVIVKEGE